MPQRSKENQPIPPDDQSIGLSDGTPRLPDVILDEKQFEASDLTRPGTAKEVQDVAKADKRLPEFLGED
jgi:hypothetical protein